MEKLSTGLRAVKVECFEGNICVNTLFYANNLSYFSPSLDGLKDLWNVCSHYEIENVMVRNNENYWEYFFFLNDLICLAYLIAGLAIK